MQTFTLNNGVEMPVLGFGVYQTPPDDTVSAVEAALATGYRHIDTAAAYGNEREVGAAVHRSGLARDDIFLETKIWITDFGYDSTLHGFDKSAGKLGVEQIDLLILHQPLPTDFEKTVQAYKALEQLCTDGRVRAIGVSNFMPDHLARLLAETEVAPAVNQIEVHPHFRQSELLAADHGYGILNQAWSPIGGITFYRDGSPGSTLEDPLIGGIAAEHGKSPAQVMLRWHLQQGPSGHPEIGTGEPDRRELRYLRFRAHHRAAGRHRRPRHRCPRRPGTRRYHPRQFRDRNSRALSNRSTPGIRPSNGFPVESVTNRRTNTRDTDIERRHSRLEPG